MRKHLSIGIRGRVQGVGFRYSAAREAEKLHLAGFARNEDDGSVYIEAEGEEGKLKTFVGWCHKGPWFAKVERLEEDWSDVLTGLSGFEVR